MLKDTPFVTTILSDPAYRYRCFAESDAGEGEGGGGAPAGETEGEAAQTPAPGTPGEPELELDEEAEAAAKAADEAELDIGPSKVKVPKAVKEAWDGLNRKMQSNAEATKTQQAAAAEAHQRANVFAKVVAEIGEEVAEMKAIDKQLEPYEKLTTADWIRWGKENAEDAAQAQIAINALRGRKSQLGESAQGKAKALQENETKAMTTMRESAAKEVAAAIPSWSPEKRTAMTSYGTQSGLNDAEIDAAMHHPKAAMIMHKAMLYDAAVARAAAKKPAGGAAAAAQTEPLVAAPARAASAPAAEPQPKVRAAGSPGGTTLRDNMPIEDWARIARKQLLGRG